MLLAGIAAVTALVFAIQQFGGSDRGDAPVASPTSDIALVPTESPVLPTATATEPPAPTATDEPPLPTETPRYSAIAEQCSSSCLIRTPRNDAALAIFRDAGWRWSWSTDDWLWSIAPAGVIATLDTSDVPVTFIRDSPETLHLYATQLPEGQTNDTAVYAFGDILDRVDGNAIVEVAQLPAYVKGITSAGIAVFKVEPAPPDPGDVVSPDSRAPLTDADLAAMLPDVNGDTIRQTIADLQASSSTDGTGVGTRAYTMPGNVMAAEFLFTRLEQYGLDVWYEDFITPEGLLSTNVIGQIPGNDDRMIYGVMAHLDSYSKENLAEAPGADDNATGLAASLEIARILSGYELKHPVQIIFVNAEETGILGSEAFARDHQRAGTAYEGIFNLDSIGSNRQGQLIYLNSDAKSSWMADLMIRLNDGYALGQDLYATQNPQIVADDNKLRDHGFEAILVARELFGQSPVHHTANDLIDGVSIPNTVSATQLVLISVAALVVTSS